MERRFAVLYHLFTINLQRERILKEENTLPCGPNYTNKEEKKPLISPLMKNSTSLKQLRVFSALFNVLEPILMLLFLRKECVL